MITAIAAWHGLALFPAGTCPRIVLAAPGLFIGWVTFELTGRALYRLFVARGPAPR
ncbi:MAG: hypothetical protein ACXU86_03660 [Archangium sp.]